MDKITLEEITNIDNHVDTHLEVHIDYANLRKIYHELNELDLSSLNFEEGSKIVGEILKIKSILDSLEEEIIDEDEEKRRELDQEYYKYLDELSLKEEIIDEDDKEYIYGSYYRQIKKRRDDDFKSNYKIIYIYDFHNEIDHIYNKYNEIDHIYNLNNLIEELQEESINYLDSQDNIRINISSDRCEELISYLKEIIEMIECEACEYEILEALNKLSSFNEDRRRRSKYNENRRKKRKSISKREAKNKKYFELKKQELSNTEIAKEMGISKQAVGQFFKRHEK